MSSTGLSAGSLLAKRYENFRGVDFTSEDTSTYHSPDSLNMYKNYKTLGRGVETRPSLKTALTFDNSIYGLFFYEVNNVEHWIIHKGTSLIDYNTSTGTQTTLKASGMNPSKSTSFVMNNILFILDGLKYYEYNGTTLKEVEGTVPITSIGRSPSGSGNAYQNVNLISNKRINYFWGDGTSTEYVLDSKALDSVDEVYIVNASTGVPVLQNANTYTVDLVNGKVTFNTAPYKPESADNVYITYTKDVGYRTRINNCNMIALFDNRVFFTGNKDYSNTIWYSGETDARYIPDLNYLLDGTDAGMIKGLAVGNEALWSFKEPSQENTTIFYHQPVETVSDNEAIGTVKGYPTINSTISTGCVATGTNFNDDIIFFSNRGMEGIQNNLESETVIGHRSSFVDRKLLNETNYEDMILAEWNGYLLVIIDNKIYLADSRQKTTINDHYEYEWFYWELEHNIASANVHDDILYLCSAAEQVKDEHNYLKYTDGTYNYWYDTEKEVLYDSDYEESQVSVETLTKVMTSSIYTLDGTDEVESYWTTPKDDFNFSQMLKTTNKKGFLVDGVGDISIDVRTDNNNFENIGAYTNTKGYIVAKLKRKKWYKLQLKFSGTNFAINDITLEVYVGSYVKRS